jgi:hypothetical protein
VRLQGSDREDDLRRFEDVVIDFHFQQQDARSRISCRSSTKMLDGSLRPWILPQWINEDVNGSLRTMDTAHLVRHELLQTYVGTLLVPITMRRLLLFDSLCATSVSSVSCGTSTQLENHNSTEP